MCDVTPSNTCGYGSLVVGISEETLTAKLDAMVPHLDERQRRGWRSPQDGQFPAGEVEPGETAEETAECEASEETGLTVSAVKRLGEWAPLPPEDIETVVTTLESRNRERRRRRRTPMAEARRVQLVSSEPAHCPNRPCRFHARVPEGAVWVGRAAPNRKRSPWANPYRVGKEARDNAHAVELYRNRCLLDPTFLAGAEVLAGKDLCCKCGPDEDCHADEFLQFVAALAEPHEDPTPSASCPPRA